MKIKSFNGCSVNELFTRGVEQRLSLGNQIEPIECEASRVDIKQFHLERIRSLFDTKYMRRLNVLPGITGLLQINERNTSDFSIWYKSWKKEINVANVSNKMNLKNPCYIPRNHVVEDALINAVNGDMKEINLIAELLKEPFTEKDEYEKYAIPSSSNEPYVTYCGT